MSERLGFTKIEERDVAEINARAILYRHDKTGAQVLSLITDDTNKVFGITFRTPPADSTGVAHILEHSVLCGSRKYPVKEPFVELLKGSLQTFLNAMTYPDKTCYPVASENLQDFYNLVDVYLDAVFYPRITEQIFQQEGWHYECGDDEDTLSYKGVVFNEMKGVYSSPDDLLGEYSQRSIFPDNTYGVDSGGDPGEIPKLTYGAFKRFHETLYHPSNSYIYFYGDDEPEKRLRILGEYLDAFDKAKVDSDVELQPAFSSPRTISQTYDPGEESNGQARAMLSMNWLLPPVTDTDLNMSLGMLAFVLIGTSASPLRKALIDSGLGEDLTGNGFASYIKQMYFSTGLRGVEVGKTDEVEALILKTLEEIVANGFDPEVVEAAVNTTEFRLRESNTGGYPRGLAYMLGALNFWLYDADPLEPLAFEGPLSRFKEHLASDPRHLESLIETHLLRNPHRASVILSPERGKAERMEREEKAKLAAVGETLAPEERASIRKQAEELKKMQETPDPPEALAAIPMLGREDLDLNVRTVPLSEEAFQDTRVLYHDLFTSDIVYLDIGFDVKTVPTELLPLVPMFGRCLTDLGTDKEDFVRLANRIGRTTGGIGASQLNTTVCSTREETTWLVVRSKATMEKAGELLELLHDILTSVNFDQQDRFRQLVLEEKAGFESHLVPSGHSYVDSRLRAGFSRASWTSEQMKGVTNLFYVRDLAKRVDEDWPGVVEQLKRIQHLLINRTRALVNVTLDAENWKAFSPSLDTFLSRLPAGPASDAPRDIRLAPRHEGLTVPSQVNFVGKGANLFKFDYTSHGSASVVVNHLRSSWLWDRVRVQGGAYGAFCSLDQRSGVFSFGSYRDPNFRETLSIFDQTSAFLRDSELDDSEITKSVIGAIGSMDSYQLPDSKGYSSMIRYITGESDVLRQKQRDEILGTTIADFRDFAGILEHVRDHGNVVAMGSAETLSADAETGDALELTTVL